MQISKQISDLRSQHLHPSIIKDCTNRNLFLEDLALRAFETLQSPLQCLCYGICDSNFGSYLLHDRIHSNIRNSFHLCMNFLFIDQSSRPVCDTVRGPWTTVVVVVLLSWSCLCLFICACVCTRAHQYMHRSSTYAYIHIYTVQTVLRNLQNSTRY